MEFIQLRDNMGEVRGVSDNPENVVWWIFKYELVFLIVQIKYQIIKMKQPIQYILFQILSLKMITCAISDL